MSIERIGKVTLENSLTLDGYDPPNADCHFTSDDRGIHLTIFLKTKSDKVAVKRARKILQDWQGSTACLLPVTTLDKLSKQKK